MTPSPEKPSVVSTAPRSVEPVHTAVPGRMRFRVEGLRGEAALARSLERAVAARPEVHRATASHRTGTVLVHFDAGAPAEPLVGTLQDACARRAARGESPPPDPAEDAGAGMLDAPLDDLFGWTRDPRLRLALGPPWLAGRLGAARLRRAFSGRAGDGPARSARPAAGHGAGAEERERPPQAPWHLREASEAARALGADAEQGLASEEARKRLQRFGPNALARQEPRSGWALFAEQLESLPVAMLGASALVSVLTGGVADAIVIGGVVLLNAAIGYATESQSEGVIRELTRMEDASAPVLRDGQPGSVPAEEVVPGDVLLLQPGVAVSADARVVSASRLSVDESALTGESLPVEKSERSLAGEKVPLGERSSMVYRGTTVSGGGGRALAVATGPDTEIGRIQQLVGESAPPETPSQRQLRELSNQLVWAGGALCVALFGLGALRGQGWLEMLRSSVSLAVAALPEGLPTVATTTLALGVRDMRRRGVLVRQVEAVETLGAVEMLCLDKTGTLTANRMRVTRVTADGEQLSPPLPADRVRSAEGPLRRLLEICVLCSEVGIEESDDEPRRLTGSPTETALVELALDAGIEARALRERLPLLEVRHRSDDQPCMVTIHDAGDGRRLLAVKGSPGEVLGRCRDGVFADGTRALEEPDRKAVDAENGRMAGDALRVLGVAVAECPDEELPRALEGSFTWLGLVGMEDPPREGIAELLEHFHRAGIETCMITGDQSATAVAVARRLGLSEDGRLDILDSTHMEKVPPEVLATLARRVRIFSRVSPTHKLEVVRALQSAGRVVGMTGDGVNDGPALRAADTGIAMGRAGSEVAREVADIVLEHDDLGSLEEAVREGRRIRANVRKAIHFLLSSNMSEILVSVSSTAAGLGQPLGPMQLLWLNLMTDIFPALGLALEPAEPDLMDHAPLPPDAPLFDRRDFGRMAAEAGLLSAGTLGVYALSRFRHGPGPRATTAAFVSLVGGQLLHALSSRSASRSFLDPSLPPNRALHGAVGASLALQLSTPWVPGLRRLLGLAPPDLRDGAAIAGGALLPLVVNEALKRFGTWSRPRPQPEATAPREESR